MSKRRAAATRVEQARIIVQARWGLPALPPGDDLEVGWLLHSDEPIEARYAAALALLRAEATAFLGDAACDGAGGL